MKTFRLTRRARTWCQAVNREFTIHCLTPDSRGARLAVLGVTALVAIAVQLPTLAAPPGSILSATVTRIGSSFQIAWTSSRASVTPVSGSES